MRATMETKKQGFIKYHLPCPLCESTDAVKLASDKDSKIKQLLIQLENANDELHSMGKKIGDLESTAKKKANIKRMINKKIDEALEKKDDVGVDNEDEL